MSVKCPIVLFLYPSFLQITCQNPRALGTLGHSWLMDGYSMLFPHMVNFHVLTILTHPHVFVAIYLEY